MTFAEFGIAEIGGATVPDQLMYPGLSQMIVEYAMPAQIFRQMYIHYPSMGRQSVTIPKEDTPSSAPVIVGSRVGEGDELPLNILPVSSSTVTAYKVGEGYQVTREMILFQQVPIIQQRLKRLGITLGNTIDFDCAATVEASATLNVATNSNIVSGKTKGLDNTVAAEAGTVGQYDVVDAKVDMMNDNLFADTFVVSPTIAGQVAKLPQYKSYMNTGIVGGYAHGEIGNVEGLRVLVSRHCGALAATNTIDATGKCYVMTGTLSTAPNPLGQYTPMGYFVEALPIQTMVQDNPRRDAYEVYALSMFCPVVVTPNAIQRLTLA